MLKPTDAGIDIINNQTRRHARFSRHLSRREVPSSEKFSGLSRGGVLELSRRRDVVEFCDRCDVGGIYKKLHVVSPVKGGVC